eukprot:TRINITY_DN43695_c0_g1_i1.p1 TRINITY_DN43695_c0_g1~~TRINITY_DN43695_c0_g1_i1.p1  ORF type:complete len:217 (-),score=21.69 TRINITY_DN43695_c0_g1_i1:80-730(-)
MSKPLTIPKAKNACTNPPDPHNLDLDFSFSLERGKRSIDVLLSSPNSSWSLSNTLATSVSTSSPVKSVDCRSRLMAQFVNGFAPGAGNGHSRFSATEDDGEESFSLDQLFDDSSTIHVDGFDEGPDEMNGAQLVDQPAAHAQDIWLPSSPSNSLIASDSDSEVDGLESLLFTKRCESKSLRLALEHQLDLATDNNVKQKSYKQRVSQMMKRFDVKY